VVLAVCTVYTEWYQLLRVNQMKELIVVLPEGHITYCTTFREPDILRNVIISGYVTFYQMNKCFANIFVFIAFVLE